VTGVATAEDDLEAQIGEWRAYLRRHRAVNGPDADELEDHLRNRIADLTGSGLAHDEAFLVAVKRIGSLDAVTREFAREHSDRLWKQLVLSGEDGSPVRDRALDAMLGWALAAAVAIKVPALFGLDLDHDAAFYGLNGALFALVPLLGYLATTRRLGRTTLAAVAGLFAVGAVVVNAYPFTDDGATTLLAALHLPIALWVAVGLAYTGDDWRSAPRWMDFIRFTGEWVVYMALLALGGGVLSGLTLGAFAAAGTDAAEFVSTWLLPCGFVGAVVVAAWLVEAKKSVVENMAPVLGMVFTPLFVVTLTGLVVAILANGIDVDRDALILFDLVLVVVLGLIVYGVSAREPAAPPAFFDRLQLGLVAATLVVDVLVLVALGRRLSDFGFSPNRTAALGENLVLLGNLAWSARLLAGFVRGRSRFAQLASWQTRYIWVYAVWAWVVVLLFPLVFGFDATPRVF
jgi:hypothetical protein